MTSIEPAGGRRRRVLAPSPAVPVRAAPPADPPIHREPVRARADRGRTLPGRRDPEWVRLAPPFRAPWLSGSQDPRCGGR
ncbi:hypothetical protein GCM10023336_13800 [Streptomyces similanensis]|uniref:Uncharacterized protein n=1 Tax=Streptomyces similanensis TaxID=1274988 RepID=A0ABP9K1X6_9ACTN